MPIQPFQNNPEKWLIIRDFNNLRFSEKIFRIDAILLSDGAKLPGSAHWPAG
jgi:hypothetical protein